MRVAVLSMNLEGIVVTAQLCKEGHEALLLCPPEIEEAAEMYSQEVPATSEVPVVKAFGAELCVVLSPELSKVPAELEEPGRKLKVYGFSPLTEHLKLDPAWGLNLLSKLGVSVIPFQPVDNPDAFREWAIIQPAKTVSYCSPYLDGNDTRTLPNLAIALRVADLMKYPGVARSLDSVEGAVPAHIALLFSGKHSITPALLVNPVYFEGYEGGSPYGVELAPLQLDESLTKLMKKLEDVFLSLRYVGFVFLDLRLTKGTSRKPVKLTIVNMSIEPPLGFWRAFAELVQPGQFGRILQSCAGGANFTPKLRGYAYSLQVLSTDWLFRNTNKTLHPIFAEANPADKRWEFFYKEDQHWAFEGVAGFVSGTAHMGDITNPGSNMLFKTVPLNGSWMAPASVALLASFGVNLLSSEALEKLNAREPLKEEEPQQESAEPVVNTEEEVVIDE